MVLLPSPHQTVKKNTKKHPKKKAKKEPSMPFQTWELCAKRTEA